MQKPTVNSPNSAYISMLSDWQITNTLMRGTKAMREAGELYLPKEPKESILAYRNRLARSVLYNAFADTVHKLVGKPFSKPVTLNEKTHDAIKLWAEDIDRCSNNITTFARSVFESALIDGMSHVLVDYPPSNGKRSLADEQAGDIRPYAIHIKATNLISWNAEIINGMKTLTQIRIREDITEPDDFWGEQTIHRIRVVYPDKFEVYQHSGKNQWDMIESGPISLGRIPLVTFYTRQTGFMTATPPLIDLAYLNIQHWQSTSDQEHILHFIRFPLLHGAGFSRDKDIDIGPNRMIISDDPQAKLTYVEHTGAAIEAGRQAIKDIEDRMNVAGLQLLIRKPGNPTATAASIDNASTDNPLQMMVRSLENTFAEVFWLMAQWAKLPMDETTGGISINQDFGVALGNSQDIDALLKTRIAGEISRETFLSEMKRRGLLKEDLNLSDEIARLDEDSALLTTKTNALR